MKIHNLSYIVCIWLLALLPGYAQELETLPASTRWHQINTDHFNIIFPKGFDREGNRVANILESIHTPASQSLGVKPRKFSVILQNQHAIPNGFVTIAPRRSEFFTTSRQDYKFLGNTDWLEFLAVHEFRHMVQFEKTYHSAFNKVMYWAFGEYGVGLGSALAAPSWFWEGDAVGVETAFTKTGRGRTPNFSKEFKANLMEKGGFNYSKQHLGSFREFVPNHYRTGYFMTTYFKRKYGVDIWDRIIQRSFRFPYVPFVFSNAIKKETGQHLRKNYSDMLSEMKSLYSKQLEDIPLDKYQVVNKRKSKRYTDYHYPKLLPDGSTVCLKSGFSDTDKFVRISPDGTEKVLHTTGIVNDPGFLSVSDQYIVWTEFEFDPRWLKKNFSVIKVYNLTSGKVRVLTHKSKYVAAAISPDSEKIIAIENTPDNLYNLHLIDRNSGNIIKKFDNPNNDYYSMPSFSADGSSVVFIRHGQSEKQIVEINIDSGIENILISSVDENFGHPVLTNEYLYFNSPYNGIDNIYALDLATRERYQVSHTQYGAFNPSVFEKKLAYNIFTKEGMNAVSTNIDSDTWTPFDKIVDRNIHYADPMVESEGHQDILPNINYKNYETKPYSKIRHMIRPYSWGLSALPTNNSFILGINSQDVLSTTSISAGLRYDNDERNWLKYATVSYQGLYPIIDVSVVDGQRSASINGNGATQTYSWKETQFLTGVRVPLLLTRSKYLQKLSFSSHASFTSVSGFPQELEGRLIDQSGNGTLRSMQHSIQFVRMLRRSKLDLHSRWGQSLSLFSRHTPLGGDYKSSLIAGESNLFFPGFFQHHSFRWRGSAQKENATNYFYDSPISYTRGYSYFPSKEFYNASFNYKMPLWYPDIHIGPLLNIQRVYINGFYDRGITKLPQSVTLESYGAELSFNFNAMRFLLLFDIGLRYVHARQLNENRIELVVGSLSF